MTKEFPNIHEHMKSVSEKAFVNILNVLEKDKNSKKIVVTHFGVNDKNWKGENFSADPKILDFLKNKVDYLFVGHSHLKEKTGKRPVIINVGSDYNFPAYEIIDI